VAPVKRCALLLWVAVAGCEFPGPARDPARAAGVEGGEAEPAPIRELVRADTSIWTRRRLPFANAEGAALVFAADGTALLAGRWGVARSGDLGKTWEIVPEPRSETLFTNDGGARFVDLAAARRTWFLKPAADSKFEVEAVRLLRDRLYIVAKGAASRRLSSIPITADGTPAWHRVFCFEQEQFACLATSRGRVFVGTRARGRPVLFTAVERARAWEVAWRGSRPDPSPIALSFPSPTCGWLLFADGTLLKTLDECATWVIEGGLPSDAAPRVTAMEWANDATGIAVGRDGLILATSDGGRTWTRSTQFSRWSLNAIVFTSPLDAWVVGDAGTVLRTCDAGRTWTQIDPGIGEALCSIVFYDDRVWILGDGSLWILRTVDARSNS
jgi:hypothetical protein